jgi:Tol biopolymer transport system component
MKASVLSLGILLVFALLVACGDGEEPVSRIVFMSERDGNGEIYVVNADGSGQTNLTDNPAIDRYPTWSLDGSRIAFVSFRGKNEEIYVMNADGTDQVNLTNNPAFDGTPAWSPDGSRIAFSHNLQVEFKPDIFVMNADGTDQTRLTMDGGYDPAWSPAQE